MPLLYLIAGACLFAGGAYIGWYARDRAAVYAGEKPLPVKDAPLPAARTLTPYTDIAEGDE